MSRQKTIRPEPKRKRKIAARKPAARGLAAGKDELAAVFLKRGERALKSIAVGMSPGRLAKVAAAKTDEDVVLQALDAGLRLNADPLAAARLRGVRMRRRLLAEAQAVSSSDFAEVLALTPQAVNKARRVGNVVGISVGERYVYPLVQLKEGRVVRGLKETLSALRVESEWSKLAFLMGNDDALGSSPLDALKNGRIDEVLSAARRYGHHIAA